MPYNVGDRVQIKQAIGWMSPIPGRTYTIATVVNVDNGITPRLFYTFNGHNDLVPAELCIPSNEYATINSR